MAARTLDTTDDPVEYPAPMPISCSAVPSSAASTVSDDALPAFTSWKTKSTLTFGSLMTTDRRPTSPVWWVPSENDPRCTKLLATSVPSTCAV
jgi:hypothetical protein